VPQLPFVATRVTDPFAMSARAPASDAASSAPASTAPDSSAQSGARSNDSITELLEQVRTVCADLSEVIRASMRSQLLVARWQVHELRLMHLDGERAETASRRLEAVRMRALCAEQLDDLENRLACSTSHDTECQDVEAALGGLKAQIASHQAAAESLRREELALLKVMSTEQVRWRDVNGRLDELERDCRRAHT
jgi:hypothetical protein